MLARALVTQPRLLLMDEPFAALDEITRVKLNNDLLELWHSQSWTVVFVTHSVDEAVYLADRIIVLRDGHIIEEGKHEELLDAGGHYAELYNTYFRHQSLEYVEQRVWESGVE